MSQEIEFTDEMSVNTVDSMGDDSSVVKAARVSIVGADAETEEGERKGLLNFLMSSKHSSPFAHVVATMMVECPIFVAREIFRHRVFDYNEVSGRYSVLKPKFYLPAEERPLIQIGKPGKYSFTAGSPEQWELTKDSLKDSYLKSWFEYKFLLEQGVAKEVARDLLPVGIYTAFYVTGNLRNWMSYLSLRTASDALFEIRDVSVKIEQELFKIAPVCMSLWVEHGRNSL